MYGVPGTWRPRNFQKQVVHRNYSNSHNRFVSHDTPLDDDDTLVAVKRVPKEEEKSEEDEK